MDVEKDIIKQLVNPDTYSKLAGILKDKVPYIKLGTPEYVSGFEVEVAAAPDLVDEFQFRQAFRRVTGRQDVGSLVKKAADGRGSLVAASDGRPLELRAILNHYFDGLLLQKELNDRLRLPADLFLSSPHSALGYKAISHQGYQEFGLSLTVEKGFSDKVVETAKLLLRRRVNAAIQQGVDFAAMGYNLEDYDAVVCSYPRGKNTGFPLICSGSARLHNDLISVINVTLAGILVRGYPADDMFSDLLLGYMAFSREQRSSRIVPVFFDGVGYSSYHYEARRRIINSTPKPIAYAVKPAVAFLTAAHLLFPEFEQNRQRLRQRIRGAAVVRATDASRFDLRSGGLKLQQGLDVLFDLVYHVFPRCPKTVKDLAELEAFLPTAIMLDDLQGSRLKWTDKAALRSGASTTSRVGSVINLMYDIHVMFESGLVSTPEDCVAYYIRHEPSTIQGDDMLKTFPSAADAAKYMGALSSLDDVGMVAEEEIPAKFLGYYVNHPFTGDPAAHTGEGLYHSANPLSNMFFPERHRTFAVGSMLSRYLILKNIETVKVNDELLRLATDPKYAVSTYAKFFDDCYDILKKHYVTHPAGAARMYFNTLPTSRDVSEVKLATQVKYEVDEILRHVAQSVRFDMNINTRLFGESPQNGGGLLRSSDVIDETEGSDDGYITTALGGVNRGDVMRHILPSLQLGVGFARGSSDNLSDAISRRISSSPVLFPLYQLAMSDCDDATFVRRYRATLDQVARRVVTDFGAFYSVTL